MKLKPYLKTFWISALSTFILVFAQTLTEDGFQNIRAIEFANFDLPLQYILANFFNFVLLTVVFIIIEKYIPTKKLLKGVIYAAIIYFLWFALKLQPIVGETFKTRFYSSLTFLVPLFIYGIFLGYLALDSEIKFKFEKRQLAYSIISLIWILFHIIYLFIDKTAEGQILQYIIWLVLTSLIIGIVFGLIFEFTYLNKGNGFFLTSVSTLIIFSSYYIYMFSVIGHFELKLFIRSLLDIISVTLAIQMVEIYFNRFKVIKDK